MQRRADVVLFEGTDAAGAVKAVGPSLPAVAGVSGLVGELVRTEIGGGVRGDEGVRDRGGDGTPFAADAGQEEEQETCDDPPSHRHNT